MHITRRHGLVSAAAAVGLAGWGRPDAAFAADLPTRRALEELSAAEINLFHDAVRDMRMNEHYADPRSWMYWAWVHDYRLPDVRAAVAANKLSRADALALTGLAPSVFDDAQVADPPRNLKRADRTRAWSRCPHHDDDKLFLPWHRAYLLLFEDVLRSYARAVDASVGDALRLPYFDAFASNGAIPDALKQRRRPDGSKNWLYNDGRKDQLYAPTLSLARGGLDVASASAASGALIDKFSVALESPAHDKIHELNSADMGSTLTAGRDPMFWLHHANVDRQWVVLDRTGQHSVLATSAWAGVMEFRMGPGNMRSIAPADMRCAATLSDGSAYAYSDETNIVRGQTTSAQPAPLPAPPRRRVSVAADAETGADGVTTLSRRNSITLPGAGLALRFGIPSRNQPELRAGVWGAGPPAAGVASTTPFATLVLENVRIASEGQSPFYLVAIRPTRQTQSLDQIVVGSISRWSLEMEAHDAEHSMAGMEGMDAPAGVTLRFPLNDRPELAAAVGSGFEVWFLPGDGEERETPGFLIDQARLELSVAAPE